MQTEPEKENKYLMPVCIEGRKKYISQKKAITTADLLYQPAAAVGGPLLSWRDFGLLRSALSW